MSRLAYSKLNKHRETWSYRPANLNVFVTFTVSRRGAHDEEPKVNPVGKAGQNEMETEENGRGDNYGMAQGRDSQ